MSIKIHTTLHQNVSFFVIIAIELTMIQNRATFQRTGRVILMLIVPFAYLHPDDRLYWPPGGRRKQNHSSAPVTAGQTKNYDWLKRLMKKADVEFLADEFDRNQKSWTGRKQILAREKVRDDYATKNPPQKSSKYNSIAKKEPQKETDKKRNHLGTKEFAHRCYMKMKEYDAQHPGSARNKFATESERKRRRLHKKGKRKK